jgi:hypothetical protein
MVYGYRHIFPAVAVHVGDVECQHRAGLTVAEVADLHHTEVLVRKYSTEV